MATLYQGEEGFGEGGEVREVSAHVPIFWEQTQSLYEK